MSLHRQEVVDIIKSWKRMKESDGSFKPIVDIYNTIQPLPSGYRLKYTDDWGPSTISAAYQQAGLADIFPCECSYARMTTLAKDMGILIEFKAYWPKLADVCLFNWKEDTSFGSTRVPDQAGIVISRDKESKTFVVMIGNKDHSVGSRTLSVNSKLIKGFICPIFDDDKKVEPTVETVTIFTSGSSDLNISTFENETLNTESSPNLSTKQPTVVGRGTLSKIAAGTVLDLVNTNIYASPKTSSSSGCKTGKYYIWSVDTVNNRVRITNAKEHVGVKGQVTGWINVNDAFKTIVEVPVSSASSNTPAYQVNAVYVVQSDELQVRQGPGTNYDVVKYSDLTPNAKKYDKSKTGCLCQGAKVTCLDIQVIGTNVWIKIPSGWVQAYYNKEYFVK